MISIQHPVFFPQLCFVAAYFFVNMIGFVVSYSGIPAVVNPRLEHIHVDFDQNQIMVRDPQGMHDRTSMLPNKTVLMKYQVVKELFSLLPTLRILNPSGIDSAKESSS